MHGYTKKDIGLLLLIKVDCVYYIMQLRYNAYTGNTIKV